MASDNGESIREGLFLGALRLGMHPTTGNIP